MSVESKSTSSESDPTKETPAPAQTQEVIERPGPRSSRWSSALMTTLYGSLVGLFVAVVTGSLEGFLNHSLERSRAQSALVLRAIENKPPSQALENLRFLVGAGLIEDDDNKILKSFTDEKSIATLPPAPAVSDELERNAPPSLTVAAPPQHDTGLALILSGGPIQLAAFQAGALEALVEKKVAFDIIVASGLGALIGALYIAPKDQESGLRRIFHTAAPHSAFLDPYSEYEDAATFGPANDYYQFYIDLLQNFNQSPVQKINETMSIWLNKLIDIDKLRAFKGNFFVCAYNSTNQQVEVLSNDEISKDKFIAALADIKIYQPVRVNNKDVYMSASTIDPLCFGGIKYHIKKTITENDKKNADDVLKTLITMEVPSVNMIAGQESDNYYELWMQSMILDSISNIETKIDLFSYRYADYYAPEFYKIQFNIQDEEWKSILYISRESLGRLYELGYEGGLRFVKEFRDDLFAD